MKKSGCSHTILVVSPSSILVRLLVNLMAKRLSCHQIFTVATASEAWEFLGRQRVDGVVCERAMAGMSGLELLVRMRESEAFRDVPVMMLFDQLDKESVVKSIHLGATELLTKPFTPRDFMVKLRRMLFPVERRADERHQLAMTNEITVMDGAYLYSSGAIVNFSMGGVLAHLKCNDKLTIYCQMDLRMMVEFSSDEQLAKTLRGQLTRVEKPPGATSLATAYYAFSFIETRPDQRDFLDKLIHRVRVDFPEWIK